MNWPLPLKGLVVLDVAGALALVVAQQVGDLPAGIWEQLPIVALGIVLTIAVIRYWTENERGWREFTERQRVENVTMAERLLAGQREALMTMLAALAASNDKTLAAVGEAQRAAYEEALERNIEAWLKTEAYRPLEERKRG